MKCKSRINRNRESYSLSFLFLIMSMHHVFVCCSKDERCFHLDEGFMVVKPDTRNPWTEVKVVPVLNCCTIQMTLRLFGHSRSRCALGMKFHQVWMLLLIMIVKIMKEEPRDGEAPRFADMVQLNAFFSERPATEIDGLIDLGDSWARFLRFNRNSLRLMLRSCIP